MVSESGSSPGHTGRPSMWNGSKLRKLFRLYAFTTLSIRQIRQVLIAGRIFSREEECPGQDSINKKLNTGFDKEPRWLRPKTDTDMSRRMAELDSSPTRNKAPPSPFSREATHDSTVASTTTSLSEDNQPGAYHNSFADSPFNRDDAWANEPCPMSWGLQEYSASPAGPQGPYPIITINDITRSDTTLTNGTQRTTDSMREALSDLPPRMISKANRLLKHFTIPLSSTAEEEHEGSSRLTTPDTGLGPGFAFGGEESGNEEFFMPDDNRPLPGDYLRIDMKLLEHRPCAISLENREHTTRSCYCYAAEEITEHHWVTPLGLAEEADQVMRGGVSAAEDFNARDPFGNTWLHLLAARDGPRQFILEAIEECSDPVAANSAGQTFLHLLPASWYATPEDLTKLIIRLDRGGFNVYKRDVFGRTVFHDVVRVLGARGSCSLLRRFNSSSYRRRDATGIIPGQQQMHYTQPRSRLHLDTTFVSPEAVASPSEEADYASDKVLLETISSSYDNPLKEDHLGRNGLHCLSAVILSDEAAFARYAHSVPESGRSSASSSSNPRKRKHGASGGSSSSKRFPEATNKTLAKRQEFLEGLLASHLDVNHYANDGTTPLMAFIANLPEEGDHKLPPAILNLIIERDHDTVHARNRKGETALHIAVRKGRKLAARTLVQAGANVHARDGAGRSVLEVADQKVLASRRDETAYAHYEACRAWLSGKDGKAVQSPTVMQEWQYKR